MLTKNDLEQISKIVGETVKNEVRSEVTRQLKPVKEDISQMRKDMKGIVNFFDSEYLDLRKRVEKIEEVLKIQPSN